MALRDYSEDEKALRRAQAIELRRSGADVESIARKLGYNTIAACEQDIGRAYTQVMRTSTEEARALDLLRIDRMIQSVWPDARDGALTAVDRVVKLIDMRAKLIGTYAPVQVEQVTMDAIEQEIKRLENEVGTAARKAIKKAGGRRVRPATDKSASGETGSAGVSKEPEEEE